MVAGESLDSVAGADLVECPVGAAVGVGDRDALVGLAKRDNELLDARRDEPRLIVEERWQGMKLDVPAALLADGGDVGAQGAAADERDALPSRGTRVHRRTGR